MDEKRVQRLAKIFEVTNSGFTREEFLASFKAVMTQILEIEKRLIKSIDYKEGEERRKLETLISRFETQLNALVDQSIKKIDTKLASVRNGKDADEQKIVENVLKKIPKPKDGVSVDEEEVVAKVLKKVVIPQTDEDRLKALEERQKELGNSRVRFGGGFSKIAMDGHIVDDETPSGTVNGSNATFTLAQAPNPISSLKVYVGGVRLRVTEDYTLSGNTITFVSAPETNSIILCDYRT